MMSPKGIQKSSFEKFQSPLLSCCNFFFSNKSHIVIPVSNQRRLGLKNTSTPYKLCDILFITYYSEEQTQTDRVKKPGRAENSRRTVPAFPLNPVRSLTMAYDLFLHNWARDLLYGEIRAKTTNKSFSGTNKSDIKGNSYISKDN